MSSDLPETHANPDAMARCLASYIADTDTIFQRVKAEFGTSPCHKSIADMRALHLKPPQLVDDYKPCDGYWPSEIRRDAERRSARFLDALKHERYLSDQRALASTMLTQPKLVDSRWKRLIEKLR